MLQLIDSEKFIVSLMIQRPSEIPEARAALFPEDFHEELNRAAFAATLQAYDEGDRFEDLNGIAARMNGVKGKDAHLLELMKMIPVPGALGHYIQQLKERRARERLADLVNKVPANLKALSFQEALAELRHDLTAMSETDPLWTPQKKLISAGELLAQDFPKDGEIIGSGILPARGGMILAGESGVGKSMLAMELAVHLVMGWECWGMPIPTSRRVLICELENPPRTKQIRLRRMLEGLEIGNLPDRLMFSDPALTRVNLAVKADQQALLDMIRQAGAEVVILDPLSSFHQESENDNAKMRSILDTVTEINHKAGTTAVVVDHFGKPPENGSTVEHRLRGASSKKDWADSLLAVVPRKSDKHILRELHFLKVRSGPQPRPVILERNKNFIHSVTHEDTLCPTWQVAEILRDLGGSVDRQGPLVEAIIEATGCTDRSAQQFIRNAVGANAITEKSKGSGRAKSYSITA